MNRDIAKFNKRITIQKNTAGEDKYKNHTNTWADYFSCWAYAGTYKYDREEQGEAVTRPEQSINFEVRYCSELKSLDSDHYRVLFNGAVYDIINVDMMNYQDQTIVIYTKFVKAVSE
jgi:SPP1 family predicted phage head-tail adaptor